MPNRTTNYSVDRTLTELNPNNSQILRTFSEIFTNFSNFFQEYIYFFVFFLSRRTEIFDLDNSESFPNYIQIISELRIFDLAEPKPNNSFVTMVLTNVIFRNHVLVSLGGARQN